MSTNRPLALAVEAAATPGSYGTAPDGFRLPERTRLGEVTLRVSNLDRSLDFYSKLLGFRVLEQSATRAVLGAVGEARALIVLQEVPGVAPVPDRGRLGLFHVAIVVPTRGDLGRLVQQLAARGVALGAGDHLVSEAFYLQDPDGLGLELYRDRPRAEWRRVNRELMMATDPVDVAGVVAAGAGSDWEGMPAGTTIGHVHLRVGALEPAAAFFSDAMGFDLMVWSYPGALFFGAGGYHHHVGTNIWGAAGASPARADEAALVEWTIELHDAEGITAGDALDAVAEGLRRGGFAIERDALGEVVTQDPWGTAVRLRRVDV
ncbi:MAG: VOC family protein [Gemmatimonadetes bacterium]|nr:VOC family protein [Gemmatimonadota bacterium]